MEIIAHRGASGHYPENTLPAFMAAAKSGADGIELDVHFSRDQELVVIHDETVNRTTNGDGLVRDYTFAQLKDLTITSKFKNEPCRLVSLQEVLTQLATFHYTGFVLIEIKTDKFHYPQIEHAIAVTVNQTLWPFEIRFCSFNLTSLHLIHGEVPRAELAYLVGDHPEKKIHEFLKYPYLTALHPKFSWVRKEASELFAFPRKLRPWTLNQKKDWQFAQQLGLAGFITDFPQEALVASIRGRRG
ncbi:glycerophosphodiester phosphodiesterase family protein [Enterococcus nangangensis]|uniref:glycerophosphodiester phosphodiesterase family protein n=1 Tax=Enterococcus nangangensis TaxID=2559926 RepID=UPI0010F64960|nr:glycerophosphodiester phosphodiesterase family protein [Enterococcus nangangensis]